MTNEAGPDQPTPMITDDPDQATDQWVDNLETAPEFPELPQHGTVTIEVPGRAVGRNKTPIPAMDVFKLASIGMKDIEIADWFGIDNNTLRYNFSVELLKGRELLKQSLRRKQLQVAMSGNAVMLIFLGKNLLGQSDSPMSSQEKTPLPWQDDQ